jgi:release factor glutamine methyltransferase
LQEKNIDEARLTVEMMLAHVLKMKRIQLYMNFDKPLTVEELASYKTVLKRRVAREPVQYIIGETEFMGLPFTVDARVLIPRPETETLVEESVRSCRLLRDDGGALALLDVGTGSGCIAVSCAKLLPGSSVHGIDVSAAALEVARLNAERNCVDIQFSVADIFAEQSFPADAKFNAIVSNPPYISRDVYETLQPEITQFEPRTAETDGSDGLSFYRRLAEVGKTLLAPDGFLAVEHAFDQQDDVMTILTQAGWRSLTPIQDYSGNPRCVIAREFTR